MIKNLSSFDIICKAHRVAKCDGELLKKVSVKNHGKGLKWVFKETRYHFYIF